VAVAPHGLVGSLEWHRLARAAARIDDDGERAVLLQTTANVAAVERYCADNAKLLRKPLDAQAPGDWGENLLVDGGPAFGASRLCIGDALELRRGSCGDVVLRLTVTSPRTPCANVDLKHGATCSKHGVRAETARTGLAGIFARVRGDGGSVQEGDTLHVVDRPNPEWTLERASVLLYGHPEAVMRYASRGILRSEWMGTHEELVALARLPELAITNWREELHRMLGYRGIGCYKGMAPDYRVMAAAALRQHGVLLLVALWLLGSLSAVVVALRAA
jgi:Uncharacterized protein conserved in bacteria